DAHDVHFTFGERLASTESVPVTGHHWRPTRQPILLSEWKPSEPRREIYTTVMSWTSYKPLKYRRQSYAQKDFEFRRFMNLPRKAGVCLEVALNGVHHANWEVADKTRGEDAVDGPRKPAELLANAGWRIVNPDTACGDLDSYQRYIES